jgi:uncharacterized protein
MTDHATPLLELFYKLRERQFPLGPEDYMDALRAISRGYSVDSRDRMLALCQMLWAKSREEKQQIADVFESILPPKLSLQETEDSLRKIELEVHRQEKIDPIVSGSENVQTPQKSLDTIKPSVQIPGMSPTSEQPKRPQARLQFAQPSSPIDVHLPAPPVYNLPYDPTFEFTGVLPITKRQMKNSWRYLRKMRRIGQRTELDVDATIQQTYQQGVLLEPAMMPRRTNQARLLMLVDEGGSMVPFRHTTQSLIESAQHSGLAQAVAYYFHDAPLRYLFNDPRMNQKHAEEIDEVLKAFQGAGILIFSDGGAARGNQDEERAERMASFLQRLLNQRFKIAWLNPTPVDRRAVTMTAKIHDKFMLKMMSYDRFGLDGAVNVLRGKKR